MNDHEKIISFVNSMIFIFSVSLRAQDVPKTPIEPAEPGTDAAEQVIIKGIALSAQKILDMEQACGVKPLPGNYWYDTNSGLYGAVGYPSYGFMLAGDDLGELQADASNGDSPVIRMPRIHRGM